MVQEAIVDGVTIRTGYSPLDSIKSCLSEAPDARKK